MKYFLIYSLLYYQLIFSANLSIYLNVLKNSISANKLEILELRFQKFLY